MQVYISYGEKPAWSDVEPVLQDDGDNPPVPIRAPSRAVRPLSRLLALPLCRRRRRHGSQHGAAAAPSRTRCTPRPSADRPVCARAEYSAKFTDAMNYFRAVLRSEEKSQRVLDLTTDVIALNSANYTAWCARARAPSAPHSTRALQRAPGASNL